ncbi:MAG: sugar-binding transcriptional regulator [Acidobacteria bacterium]|nr:sugar-binding transcriptional regulator [Acidobacteriota bacterium]
MSLDNSRLLVKVARLYYDQNLTQAEIAERLRLSRQKIQRMLSQALDSRVVQISIHPVLGTYSHLERVLEERFQLAEALVIETTAYDNQAVVAREIGAGAAAYLLRVVRPNDKIVISWGNSLLGMVNALPYPSRTHADGIQVIQGLGGLGDPNHEIHATQLVRRAAGVLNADAILLPAPAVAGSRAARKALESDRYVRQVLEKARGADLAFVGIGSSSAETILVPEFWNIMTPATLAELEGRGAVGSINLRYFDERGQTVPSELNSCVIGLTLEELKKIYRVVVIAGGRAKLKAIAAALRAGLVNVLVTDHLTAQELAKTEGRVRGAPRR